MRPRGDELPGGHRSEEVSAQSEVAVGSGLKAQGSGAAGAVTVLDLSFFPFFPFVFLSSYLSFVNGDEG